MPIEEIVSEFESKSSGELRSLVTSSLINIAIACDVLDKREADIIAQIIEETVLILELSLRMGKVGARVLANISTVNKTFIPLLVKPTTTLEN